MFDKLLIIKFLLHILRGCFFAPQSYVLRFLNLTLCNDFPNIFCNDSNIAHFTHKKGGMWFIFQVKLKNEPYSPFFVREMSNWLSSSVIMTQI
jgi:GT2 family glycosyltransferase